LSSSSPPWWSTTWDGAGGSGRVGGTETRLIAVVESPGKHLSSNTAWLLIIIRLSTGSQNFHAFTPSG
jgi:hypothetical protein